MPTMTGTRKKPREADFTLREMETSASPPRREGIRVGGGGGGGSSPSEAAQGFHHTDLALPAATSCEEATKRLAVAVAVAGCGGKAGARGQEGLKKELSGAERPKDTEKGEEGKKGGVVKD